MFQVEIVWNRTSHFVPYGKRQDTLDAAIKYGQKLENMGDGACVKNMRVTNENGRIVFANGKKVGQAAFYP